MTFLEKYLEDHQDGLPYDCPSYFGYGSEDADRDACDWYDGYCSACWKREMPESVAEEKYEDPEYPFEEYQEDDEPDLRGVFPDIYENTVMSIENQPGFGSGFTLGNWVEPEDPKLHINLTVDETVELINQGRFERKETLGNITLEIEIEDFKKNDDDGDYVLIQKKGYDKFKETSDLYDNLKKDFDEIRSAYEELKIKYDELLETHSEAMAKAEIQELKYNPDLVEAVEKAFKNLGMKVVLIRHCNNTSSKEAYLFEVPSDYDVKTGDHVLVNTKKGTATGICLTNSTYVNEDFVEQLAPILGGKCPLKKVIGTYHLEEFDIPEEEENV